MQPNAITVLKRTLTAAIGLILGCVAPNLTAQTSLQIKEIYPFPADGLGTNGSDPEGGLCKALMGVFTGPLNGAALMTLAQFLSSSSAQERGHS